MDFFKHINSTRQPELQQLINEFGAEGLGFYWYIISRLLITCEQAISYCIEASNNRALFDTKAGAFLAEKRALFNLLLLNPCGFIESPDLLQYRRLLSEQNRANGKVGGRPKKRVQIRHKPTAFETIKPTAFESSKKGSPLKNPPSKEVPSSTVQSTKQVQDLDLKIVQPTVLELVPLEPEKLTYAPRISMTEEQYRRLVLQYGEDFVKLEIQKCSDWHLASGRTTKDGAARMRNWMLKASAAGRRYSDACHAGNVERVDFKSIEIENRKRREREAIESVNNLERRIGYDK